MATTDPIYLDNHATTPVDPRVLDAMLPYFRTAFGNPSSPHAVGRAARRGVERARDQVAAAVGASPEAVTFTPSATSANNLAIWGAVEAARDRRDARRALVVSAVEHKSVLGPAHAAAERYGLELRVAPVDHWGNVDLVRLARLCRGALLVSVQLANNEIGTIQNVPMVAAIAHAAGALAHCDATQGVGKTPFSMATSETDLVTFGGHKLYGPKGAAALLARPGILLVPRCQGGPQEAGAWPGTENVPAIVGFGAAVEIAVAESAAEAVRLAALRARFLARLATHAQVGVVGPFAQDPATREVRWPNRLAGNLSLLLPVPGRAVVLALADRVCLSTGSACGVGAEHSTDVLRALHFSEDQGDHVLRVGIGRFNTAEEIDAAADEVGRAILATPRG